MKTTKELLNEVKTMSQFALMHWQFDKDSTWEDENGYLFIKKFAELYEAHEVDECVNWNDPNVSWLIDFVIKRIKEIKQFKK